MNAAREWYRTPDWEPQDREAFERRLARSRSRAGRAQYLRIKALALMEPADPARRAAGMALLQRIVDEYADQRTEVAFAHELLGRTHEESGRFDAAEEHYRRCVAFYAVTRSGTSGLCDLRLAELILRTKQAAKYPEAEAILTDLGRDLGRHLLLDADRYRYEVARARLAAGLGQRAEAAAHAQAALALAQPRPPQFPRHPTVGVVHTDPTALEEMRSLAGG